LLDINFAQVFIAFIVLLFSLTVHEMSHAWTADRLGDPTARLRGRVSLNPIVHADLIGTVVFPLLALIGGVPLIGWAKPVPVNVNQLRHKRRDYVLVAAAGPARGEDDLPSGVLWPHHHATGRRLRPHGDEYGKGGPRVSSLAT